MGWNDFTEKAGGGAGMGVEYTMKGMESCDT